MFEMIPYKAEHGLEILAGQTTEPGLEMTKENIALCHEMETKGPAMTGVFDGKIVSCGGIWVLWPGAGEQWMLNVDDIGDYHIDPQIAKDWMYEQIKQLGLWRLQTPLRSDYPEGEVYAKWLGFTFEARLEMYHHDRTDALMYKIIIEGD